MYNWDHGKYKALCFCMFVSRHHGIGYNAENAIERWLLKEKMSEPGKPNLYAKLFQTWPRVRRNLCICGLTTCEFTHFLRQQSWFSATRSTEQTEQSARSTQSNHDNGIGQAIYNTENATERWLLTEQMSEPGKPNLYAKLFQTWPRVRRNPSYAD